MLLVLIYTARFRTCKHKATIYQRRVYFRHNRAALDGYFFLHFFTNPVLAPRVLFTYDDILAAQR